MNEAQLTATIDECEEEIDRLRAWLDAIYKLPTTASYEQAVAMAGTALQTRQNPPYTGRP